MHRGSHDNGANADLEDGRFSEQSWRSGSPTSSARSGPGDGLNRRPQPDHRGILIARRATDKFKAHVTIGPTEDRFAGVVHQANGYVGLPKPSRH